MLSSSVSKSRSEVRVKMPVVGLRLNTSMTALSPLSRSVAVSFPTWKYFSSYTGKYFSL